MTIMEELVKGFRFKVSGMIGDPLKITDDKTKEVTRFVRLLGFGKTHNLPVETDDELNIYKPGTWARASGQLGRKSSSTSVSLKITELLIPGSPGWRQPKDEEVNEGCTFEGVGIIAQKKMTEYMGVTYRKLQLNGFGDAFLFENIDFDLFDRLPDKGAINVTGNLETELKKTERGLQSLLTFNLKDFKALVADRPEPPKGDNKAA